MMLTVTTVTAAASALYASALFAAAPAASSAAIPPMIVNVVAVAGMSQQLVDAVLAEAAAIWRPSGVSFIWRRAPKTVPSSPAPEFAPYVPNALQITIGENRGTGRDGRLPLGWIVFDDVTVPQQEIYLSFANMRAMMDNARGVIGIVDQMPIMQRDSLLARAMGRALAHELGHYLLASKVHTKQGLMKAVLTAVELFSANSSAFRIDPVQRGVVAARLHGQPRIASR